MRDAQWIEYYNATNGKTKPRSTLLKAIELFENESCIIPKLAIDLGCGAGLDSLALLKSGWAVYAIDNQPAAIANLLAITPSLFHDQLSTSIVSFETIHNLPLSYLINASFSLPFLAKQEFYKFWTVIEQSIYPEGRFAGSFFGEKDGWRSRSDMTFLSCEKLFHLFKHFKIELFEEEKLVHPDALGCSKLWHKYSIVAKKLVKTELSL